MDACRRVVVSTFAVILSLQISFLLLVQLQQPLRTYTIEQGNINYQIHDDDRPNHPEQSLSTTTTLTTTAASFFPILTRHRRRLADASSPSVTNIKIVGVGLPRTGTEAMQAFWTCQGISSVHYCCDKGSSNNEEDSRRTSFPCIDRTCGACVAKNMKQGKSAFSNCVTKSANHNADAAAVTVQAFAQIDVETSEPFSWFLPQHNAALEALVFDEEPATRTIWLLTKRKNASTWATSVLHWHSITERLLHALGINDNNSPSRSASLELPKAVTHEEVVESLQASLDRVHDEHLWRQKLDSLSAAYERHIKHVRTTATKLGIPLVEVVVDDTQAEKTLRRALTDLGVPLSSSNCWEFDPALLDEDWRDFAFPF